MRVLVAGATGVIGSRLVPLLTSVGHEVVALVRPSSRKRVVPVDQLEKAADGTPAWVPGSGR
jgi:uncharacterized protein YbjT (DUF2867 family)